MPKITFKSIDEAARTATFDIDGSSETRNIPDYFEGTIDDYLMALANGLAVEFDETEKTDISAPETAVDSVLVDTEAV